MIKKYRNVRYQIYKINRKWNGIIYYSGKKEYYDELTKSGIKAVMFSAIDELKIIEKQRVGK